MSAEFDALEALIPPPGPELPEPDWIGLEERLGVRLPFDYKRLVRTYGQGSFDGFLWVLQPSAANQNLDLELQRVVRVDALRTLLSMGEAVPYGLGPGQEELLPWAFTDNGDVCFWVTSGSADPDQWRVAINEARGPLWETFDGSASAFLVAVLSGAVHIGVFPDDFPSEAPAFEPL